jgi:radical SAM protein with 4Fe4S-binding SPASM domain
MNRQAIARPGQAVSCYFRTTVPDGSRKALIQITERCNLHCAHCFVSATRRGDTMRLTDIERHLITQLISANVTRVTLTGGEPFAHPDPIGVARRFREAGMSVGVCTNATLTTPQQIEELAALGGVHVNVSLDGFSETSHGRFRGDPASFRTTVATVRQFAAAGLLQGLLCTPNNLATAEEYRQLCEFAVDQGAAYVLMNPLSSMGRGVRSKDRLEAPIEQMRGIRDLTAPLAVDHLETVYIRFPNDDRLPLAGCEAGRIIYIFTPGDVTVCPYLVFAARTTASRHDPREFIVGNVFRDSDIAERLNSYHFHDRYQLGANSACPSCDLANTCGKGCPAAVISAGGRIGDVDTEQCPRVPSGSLPRRSLLPQPGGRQLPVVSNDPI